MCEKKPNVEVYSKQRVSLVRMEDENTNSGCKQQKSDCFGREPDCDWK